MRILGLLALATVVVLLVFPAVAVAQESQPPCRFQGTVEVNGEPAAERTFIRAILGEYRHTTRTFSADGESVYSMDIAAPEGTEYRPGAAIAFIVGGLAAAETGRFEPGGNITLNLTAEGEEGGVTIIPTIALLLLLGAALVAFSPLRHRLGEYPAARYLAWLCLAAIVAGAFWLFSRNEWTWWEFPTEQFIPVGEWINTAVAWLTDNLEPLFNVITLVIREPLVAIRNALLWLPWWSVIVLFAITGWRFAGLGIAAFSAIALFFIGTMGLWDECMTTLAIMVVAVIVSLLVGIPTGILAGRSDRFEAAIRPILDGMQTMPSFVYLVPAVIFFGLGMVPAVIATVIYAVSPCIRLTSLGIRQVPTDVVEAGRAFGSTPRQLLVKIQLPLALPNIMAGVTQTIMLALAMVVIGSMIGAAGLGLEVLRGIQQLDTGRAFTSGLSIVIVAIILDRISQNLGKGRTSRLAAAQ